MIILATFLIGLTLNQFPFPESVLWFIPDWVVLVHIYWVITLPHRVGLLSAFSIGLLQDVLKGSVLGLNALSLTIITFLILLLYRRLRMFPIWQQSFLILILVGINQLLFYWMQSVTGTTNEGLHFLIPCVVSALLWPWVYAVLHTIKTFFRLE